jgi:hypothetical protein
MRRTVVTAVVSLPAGLWACTDETPTTVSEPSTAHAGLGTPLEHSSARIDIAVIGDVPYGPIAAAVFPAFIESIDEDPKVRRVVHVGDIKSGSTVCSDEWFATIRASFDSFADPLVYTPGDNEWTDCHRPNNGAYDPLERLERLREVFFDRPGYTLGAQSKRVVSQTGYPENQLWTESRVVFVAVHEVGSNNSLAPWTGLSAPTAEQLDEWEARDAANREWLAEAFDLAESEGTQGVVVFTQADMFDPAAPRVGRSGLQGRGGPCGRPVPDRRCPDLVAKRVAREVTRAAAPPLLGDEAGVEQSTEIVAGRGWRDASLLFVPRPIRSADEALLERDHEAIRPAALLDEVFEVAPSLPCHVDLSEAPARLVDVRLDAERDPLGGIALG